MPDLEYALKMGYRIVMIYEVLAHFSLDYCMQKHFQHLAGRKCSTSFPKTKNHQCQQACKGLWNGKKWEKPVCPMLKSFVATVNESLDLSPISEQDIADNTRQKDFIKTGMNATIGKWTQNNLEKTTTKLVHDAKSCISILQNPNLTIKAAQLLPESEILMLQYHKDGSFETLNRTFSCIIGAFITAHYRVVLHEAINLLDLTGCIIAYTDTDSLVNLRNSLVANPVNIHNSKIGSWKNELPKNLEIIRATFVGPKNYCLLLLE